MMLIVSCRHTLLNEVNDLVALVYNLSFSLNFFFLLQTVCIIIAGVCVKHYFQCTHYVTVIMLLVFLMHCRYMACVWERGLERCL